MKKLLSGLFFAAMLLSLNFVSAQENITRVKDFITEHDNLKQDISTGEIEPVNDKEIKKLITFFVQKEFPNIAEKTRNIIWDSYQTFINNSSQYHYHTFICQIKVKDQSRLKYLEVKYYPVDRSVKTDFKWRSVDDEDGEPINEFYTDDEWTEFKRKKKKRKEELGIE